MVLYKLGEKVTEMDGMRDRICAEIKLLRDSSPSDFLNGAVDCHLRKSSASKAKKKNGGCKLCQVKKGAQNPGAFQI